MNRVRGVVALLGAVAFGGAWPVGGSAVAAPGEVTFASRELWDCVNAALVPAQPPGTVVTESQAATIVTLNCRDGEFTDLTGITALTSLETVDLSGGAVTDISVFLTSPEMRSVRLVTATGMHRTLPDIPVGTQQPNVVRAPHVLSLWEIPTPNLPTSVVTRDDVRNWTFLDAHAAGPNEPTLSWDANNLLSPDFPQFHFSGSVTQSAVWLPPTITGQPASVTVLAGTAASLTAAATSNQTPRIQWQQRVPGGVWEDIAGQTAGTLALASVTLAQDGTQYRAVFTTGDGTPGTGGGTVTSDPATLTVVEPVSYLTHPVAQSTAPSGAVQFRAEFFSYASDPQFRWEFSADGGATWANVDQIASGAVPQPGGNQQRALGRWVSTLDVSGVGATMNGWLFRAVVWDQYTVPVAVSAAAQLTVAAVDAGAPPVLSRPAGPAASATVAAGVPVPTRDLPRTGATVLPLAFGAGALIVLGAVVLLVRRRRSSM